LSEEPCILLRNGTTMEIIFIYKISLQIYTENIQMFGTSKRVDVNKIAMKFVFIIIKMRHKDKKEVPLSLR